MLNKTKITVFKKGEKLKATERGILNEQNNEAAHEFNHLGITLERAGSWIKKKTLDKTNSYPGLVDTTKCVSLTPNNHILQILWL